MAMPVWSRSKFTATSISVPNPPLADSRESCRRRSPTLSFRPRFCALPFSSSGNVNLTVEAARLGQMTDYDKLTLEVWTNGAISPQDSIGYAAKLLKDHMTIFINFEELPEATEEPSDRGLDRVRV